MKRVFLIVIAVALALTSCMLGVAIFEQERGESTAPDPVPTTSIVPAVRDLGSGTPGAGCATNRQGKTFILDGVTYVCSGPKPFTWKPQGTAELTPEETRETARKVVKSKAPKSRAPEPKPTTKTPDPTEEPSPEPTEVYYANCQAAKDAGAAPIKRGEPGYAKRLDRDGDGIACDK